MLRRQLALAACFIALCSVGSAHALDPTHDSGGGPARNFGDVGQLAFSSENTLTIQHSTDDVSSIFFAPAADYFVIKNLSVGGFIGIDYTKVDNGHGFRFSIGPRVGYNFSFTNTVGVWPKIGFSYAHSNASLSGDASTNNNSIAVNIFAPIMFHPVTHFFVGLGPFLDADLSGDNRVTVFGIKLTIGGWLDV
jgi:hypothetical protein